MNVNSKCVCVDAGYMNEHEVLFEVKSTCLTKMWKIFKKLRNSYLQCRILLISILTQ